MEFGKSRVQYRDYFWTYYKFDRYSVYYYKGGGNIAVYTAQVAQKVMEEIEQKFDYYLQEDDRVYFLVYNKIEQFQQSNIGVNENTENSIGGLSRTAGSKVFLYFDGDHRHLEKQIRTGIAEIVIRQMMYGETWKDMLKNAALMTLPDWYMQGIYSYAAESWSTETDNIVRDAILNGKYRKFNRLNETDARYAGHALWSYIAETYGQVVIPNVLYMARISRNVESGFLFVLGASVQSLISEMIEYYTKRYEMDTEFRQKLQGEEMKVRTRPSRTYTQLKVSPDGKYTVFATNEMGQKKVWLYDMERKKTKRILKQGHRLNRINDASYPLLSWHPSGKVLAIIREQKGEVLLTLYTPETKKTESKQLFLIDRVVDFSYSDDGKQLIMSAIVEGQSNIYTYKIAPNIQEAVTKDIEDDLQPAMLPSGGILFSSSRLHDTLKFSNNDVKSISLTKDIFLSSQFGDAHGKPGVLRRVTNTPLASENQPFRHNENYFTYLSDESGIINRYLAHFDSIIIGIDTVFHYRYFSQSVPLTNYSTNILEHHFSSGSGKFSEIVLMKGLNHLYTGDINRPADFYDAELTPTKYMDGLIKEDQMKKAKAAMVKDSANVPITETLKFIIEKVPEPLPEPRDSSYIDINNYQFNPDKKERGRKSDIKEQSSPGIISVNTGNDSSITNAAASDSVQFMLPKLETYNINFTAGELQTQLDFSYANQGYQRFNGGPYINPGLGLVAKVKLLDLFEDYEVEGGMRFGLSNDNREFYLSLENRIFRLDKKYMFQRQQLSWVNDLYVQKMITHQLIAVLKYPFTEVSSVRATFSGRYDQIITMSTDATTLKKPNENVSWGTVKLEYIFDNALNKGLNLYNGTRAKVFAETYRQFALGPFFIAIVGADIRHYLKIHRDFIWANRFAASTSFGTHKLIYYMGGVDNWMLFSDKPRFSVETPIATDQNYYFQTIATPVRGFIQNIRNGNSFAVVNSELRLPVFKYLLDRPIKSDFISNFQVIAFGDVGTAWTGKTPYSNDNSFNVKTIEAPPITVILKNHREPIVGGYGFGVRSRLWGYFVRFDYAYGVEDTIIQKPVAYLSLGFDF